jgi:hypothetical protein
MIPIPYHNETEGTRILQSFQKFFNREATPKQVVSHLRKIVGSNVLITTNKSPNVDPNDININAYYDPDEDEAEDKPFEIMVVFPKDNPNVTMDKEGWREFATKVIDFLEHEMIHQAQYRSRDFRSGRQYRSRHKDPITKESQEYLGNPDEIEAYAYNLSRELIRKTNNDYDRTMRLLKNFSQTAMTKDQAGRLLSPNLFGYFKDFGFDTTHPVLKTLMKKTYQFVQQQLKQAQREVRVAERNTKISKDTERVNESLKQLDKEFGSSYTIIVE